MSAKKCLYQPAPERLGPSTSSSLPQGDASGASSRNVPKIKQGVLETSRRGTKPLTSTLKSATKPAKSTVKPLVVCHNPTTVHSQLQSSDNKVQTGLATNAVQSPKSVVIQPKPDASQDKANKRRPGSAQKGRFVKSRYHQAAAEVAMGSTPKLSSTKKSVSKSSVELSGSYSSKTPMMKSQKPGKTSTPASTSVSPFNWNASAIERAQGSFNPMEVSAEHTPLESPDSECDDPEILYCQYLQWHLLNQTVKNNMRRKAKQYTEQLNFLKNKNSEQRKDIEELKKEVLLLEHQSLLENQLEAQRSAMAPAVDKLQSAIGSFKQLAENLDTTRHSLPLAGTQDPDQLLLEATLDETRNLLGQINILTRSQAPGVEKMAESIEALCGNCVKEAETLPSVRAELKKGVASVLQQASLVCQYETAQS